MLDLLLSDISNTYVQYVDEVSSCQCQSCVQGIYAAVWFYLESTQRPSIERNTSLKH